MSVLLNVLFLCCGAFAVGALLANWRRYRTSIAALRDTLLQPSETIELRLNVQERVLAPQMPSRRRLRHVRRPKPIRHRLRRQGRAAA